MSTLAWRGAILQAPTTQVIPSGTLTQLIYPTTVRDTDGFVASNRFVIPSGLGGIYLIHASISFSTASSGQADLLLANQALSISYARQHMHFNTVSRMTAVSVFAFNGGEDVAAFVLQTSGSDKTPTLPPFFTLTYLGP